ncbi:MAG: hypothetical protein K2X81_12005 [Candidatus Obscuribacterales bacterium]|nr:hypothetical protein [Candidatus Obscuribacterales bacterium]
MTTSSSLAKPSSIKASIKQSNQNIATKTGKTRRLSALNIVHCAFAAGAVITFVCIINSLGPIYWNLGPSLSLTVSLSPPAIGLQERDILDGTWNKERKRDELLANLSEQIDRHPNNLKLRCRRVEACHMYQDITTRGNDLACALADMQFVVAHRGNAKDYASLALLQAMTNDPNWKSSLDKAKNLGYKIAPSAEPANSNWATAAIRDYSCRQANIIPWLQAMTELTGDHSSDYFIPTIYLQAGKYDKAIEEYDKIINGGFAKSDLAHFLLYRGACHKWLGHAELAKDDFRKCVHSATLADSIYLATAKAALGDRSNEEVLEGKSLSDRVLYYLLSDQYEKAASVSVTEEGSAPFRNLTNSDQFEMALGIDPGPKFKSEKTSCLLGGPADYSTVFLENSVNIHLLRAMAFEKLKNLKMAEAEHRAALAFIPANIRRELNVN